MTTEALTKDQKAYEDFMKEFGGVTTWTDFYKIVHTRFNEFRKCGCYHHLLGCALIGQAFILTMEDLPEEGDIRNIIERMARMLCFQREEKFSLLAEAHPEARGIDILQLLTQLGAGPPVTGDAEDGGGDEPTAPHAPRNTGRKLH